MNYPNIVKGSFINRPNRFIAYVQILSGDGEEKTVICHVKNTGRCKELLLPALQYSFSIIRKPLSSAEKQNTL